MTEPFKVVAGPNVYRTIAGQAADSDRALVISAKLAEGFRKVGQAVAEVLGYHSMFRADTVVDSDGNCWIVEINTYSLAGGSWFDMVENSFGIDNGLPKHSQLLKELAAQGKRYVLNPRPSESTEFQTYALHIPCVSLDTVLAETDTPARSLLLAYPDDDLAQLGHRLLWKPDQLRHREDKRRCLDWCTRMPMPQTVMASDVALDDPGWIFKHVTGSQGRQVQFKHPGARSRSWIAQRMVDTHQSDGYSAVFGVFANGAVWPKIKRDAIVGAKADGSCWAPILHVENPSHFG